jgi:hypothetical protein
MTALVASRSFETQHRNLVGLGQRIREPRELPAGEPKTLSGEDRAECERLLERWIASARAWLEELGAILDDRVGAPLEYEEAHQLLEMIRAFRRDLRTHLFAPDGTLGVFATFTRQGASMREASLTATYRELLAKLQPYRDLESLYKSKPWGGTTNPVEIHEAMQLRNLDSDAIITRYDDYRQVVVILLDALTGALAD